MDGRLKAIHPGARIVVGVRDLEMQRLAKDRGLQIVLIGSVRDAGDPIADHEDLLEAPRIEGLFGSVGIDVSHRDEIATADFESAVAGAGIPQLGHDAAQGHLGVAPNGIARHGFLITALGFADHLDLFARLEDGKVLVVDLDVEPFSGFHLFDLSILVGEGGAHFLEGLDGPAVVALLEVAQSDEVIRFVDLGGSRKIFDHLSHDFEAVPIAARFIVTSASVQKGVGALLVIRIGLLGRGIIVHPGLVELALLLEQVIRKTEVGFEANGTPRVALGDRFPDLEGLFILAHFEACIARLQEFAGGTIFDDRTVLARSLGERNCGAGEEKREEEAGSAEHDELYEQFLERLSIFPQ